MDDAKHHESNNELVLKYNTNQWQKKCSHGTFHKSPECVIQKRLVKMEITS